MRHSDLQKVRMSKHIGEVTRIYWLSELSAAHSATLVIKREYNSVYVILPPSISTLPEPFLRTITDYFGQFAKTTFDFSVNKSHYSADTCFQLRFSVH